MRQALRVVALIGITILSFGCVSSAPQVEVVNKESVDPEKQDAGVAEAPVNSQLEEIRRFTVAIHHGIGGTDPTSTLTAVVESRTDARIVLYVHVHNEGKEPSERQFWMEYTFTTADNCRVYTANVNGFLEAVSGREVFIFPHVSMMDHDDRYLETERVFYYNSVEGCSLYFNRDDPQFSGDSRISNEAVRQAARSMSSNPDGVN